MFTAPAPDSNPKVEYLDDFAAGQVFDLGSFTLTAEEMIEFAERHDPQVFHTDPVAAADSMFGGLIASGWQTVGCVMRLMVENMIPAQSSLGSPGIDELRWLKPVRPGVEYRVVYTVDEVRESRSKPDRGVVMGRTVAFEVTSGRDAGPEVEGEPVMSFKGMGMYRKRPTA